MIGLGTGTADVDVSTIVELPVGLQLGATGATIKALLDAAPGRPAVLLHVVVGDLVRDALVAESRHQPIKHRSGIAAADRRTVLVGPQLCPDLIDSGRRARQPTNGMD